MKKYLENLSENDLRTIISCNNDLRDIIKNSYIENTMDYIQNILDTLNGKLYSVGFYQDNYWKGYKTVEQLENIKKATDIFFLCSREELKKVGETMQLLEVLNNIEYCNKQYDNLKMKIDSLFDEIDSMVLNELNGLTDAKYIDDDLLYDYLIDMLENEEKTYYIKDDDLSIIYRNKIEVLF